MELHYPSCSLLISGRAEKRLCKGQRSVCAGVQLLQGRSQMAVQHLLFLNTSRRQALNSKGLLWLQGKIYLVYLSLEVFIG